MPFLKGISNKYQFQINTNFKTRIRNLIFDIGNWKFQKGFTLIELLIVITIIGILATLILASFGAVQAKARDGRRKSDLAQLKRAMEIAKSDCQGSAHYPYLGGNNNADAYDKLINYLANKKLNYISSIIQDPVAGNSYSYAGGTLPAPLNVCPDPDPVNNPDPTTAGVTDYAIWAKLERTSDADAVESRKACVGKPEDQTWNESGFYVVCNN